MSVTGNTLYLRMEGPLQSWGDSSKFVIRRSMDAPTKSGVLGLICCAMGQSRYQTVTDPIPDEELKEMGKRLVQAPKDGEPRRALLDLLGTLGMGVRIDRPGIRWWDYQTVGARIGMTTAAGGLETGPKGTVVKRLEYLADASFLVALQGDAELIDRVGHALASPKWPLYLGRKSCPPSVPILAAPGESGSWPNPATHDSLVAALQAVPWRPRYRSDTEQDERIRSNGTIDIEVLTEWRRTEAEAVAPPDAEVWYDVPYSFDPPVHHARFVLRGTSQVQVGEPLRRSTPAPSRPRADYRNKDYEAAGKARLAADRGLCVFCKSPGTTVQHVTYRRAGGGEDPGKDLRSLCRLCHDAVTMVEYGLGMGLDRIDPCDPGWRDDILRTRAEILQFRSEEGRRRALRDAPERIRSEVLEENS